jgi:hypothetical protein
VTKEEVYDAEIAPLMSRIIAVCVRHRIAMLADFALGDDPPHGELKCTTALLSEGYGPTPGQLAALEILGPKK